MEDAGRLFRCGRLRTHRPRGPGPDHRRDARESAGPAGNCPEHGRRRSLVEGLAESEHAPLTGHLEHAFHQNGWASLPPRTQTFPGAGRGGADGRSRVCCGRPHSKLGLDWSDAAPAEGAGLVEIGRRVYFSPSPRAGPRPTGQHLFMSVWRCNRALCRGQSIRSATPTGAPGTERVSTVRPRRECRPSSSRMRAGRAQARGGLLAAAALLERAAPPDSRRGAPGPTGPWPLPGSSGPRAPLDSALRLLSTLESEPAPPSRRAALADQLRGKIAFDRRRGADAAVLLLSAARRLQPFDPGLARENASRSPGRGPSGRAVPTIGS